MAYCAREAGLDVAIRLAQALRDAYSAIVEHPGIGSPRYGSLLGIEGLRSRKLGRFPYLVFYFQHDDHIDVWRVLHAHSDIPAWLRESAQPEK